MELFKNKQAAAFAAVFTLTAILTSALRGKIKLILLCVSAVFFVSFAVAAAVSKMKRRGLLKLTALVFAFSAALSNGYFRIDTSLSEAESLYGRECNIKARITDIVYENVYSGSYIADVTEIDGVEYGVRIKLETYLSPSMRLGDIITANAEFVPFTNSGGFDEKAYFRPRGVILSAEAENVTVTGNKKDLKTLAAELSDRLSARLEISAEAAGGDFGMASALLLGKRDSIDAAVSRDFVYTGASHLLAVSGAHFTILLGAVERVLKKLTLHKTPRTLILIVLVVFYMLLTGLSASVLRAGVMLIIYHLSHFARREPDGVTSLFAAAAVIFIFSPSSVTDVGLLLSLSAMLSCILAERAGVPKKLSDITDRLSGSSNVGRAFSRALKRIYLDSVTGLFVMLSTLPIVWIFFGRVSLFSPISTIVLNLPVTLILYLSPIVLLTFNIPWLCTVFSYPASFLCRLSASLVGLLAKPRFASLALPTSGVITVLFCIIIVTCLILAAAGNKRMAKISGSIVAACFFTLVSGVFLYTFLYDGSSVTYTAVGENEAFAVTDGVRSLVCDISNGGSAASSASVEMIKEKLSSRVNVYMLTHLHTRHVKTVSKLTRREYIDELWLPEPREEFSGDADTYYKIKSTAEENGVRVVTYRRGDTLDFGDIKIDTTTAKIDRSAQPVIMLSFESGGERTTYLGSSVHESELFELAKDICRNSDTVIFGIHGPVMKSGADYGILPTAKVLYAVPEAAEFNIDKNPTEVWNVYENGDVP